MQHALRLDEPGGALAAPAAAPFRPTDLPTPPAAALEVLRACADPRVDARGLGRFIEADPALAVELLRIVNSAYFGFEAEVSSLSHAVSIVGLESLRSLALCVAVRGALRPDTVHGLDTRPIWRCAVYRAAAARALAGPAGGKPEECFAAGLILDIGLLALFALWPARAGGWVQLRECDPEDRRRRERDLFGDTHDRAGAGLAVAWGLPAGFARAIGEHHVPPEDAPALVRVAACADWVAALYEGGDTRSVLPEARRRVADLTGLGPEPVDALLEAVGEDAGSAAAAMGVEVGDGPDYGALMRDANLALTEENLDFMALNLRLRGALEERDRMTARLRRELENARVIQRSLLPPDAGPEPAAAPFDGISIPARELSGDLFDYFPLADGRHAFALADVSGKGMDAALLMAQTGALFHCLGKTVRDPARLMGILNQEIAERGVRGMFVTMVAGVYDPGTGAVLLVNAGHPPPLLRERSGNVIPLAATAPPLGVLPRVDFQNQRVQVGDGALYLFSDGFLESACGDRSRLAYSRVVDLIGRSAPHPRRERLAWMLNTLGLTAQEARDDVTVLMLAP